MTAILTLTAAAVLSFLCYPTWAFIIPKFSPLRTFHHHHHGIPHHMTAAASSNNFADIDDYDDATNRRDAETLRDVRAMSIRQLRDELQQIHIPTQGIFEKEELVMRLYDYRKNYMKNMVQQLMQPLVTTLFMRRHDPSQPKQVATSADGTVLQAAEADVPFASIELELYQPHGRILSLVVDTACSGVILRPSAAFGLPVTDATIMVLGAGGVPEALPMVPIRFVMGDQLFGPYAAAVQDMFVLPSHYDGIVGLSFLSDFASVEMDFHQGRLVLHRLAPEPEVPPGKRVVAEGSLRYLPGLCIYATDVRFGGRGPVTMLVDSGGSQSLLNWQGVSDLSLSKDSPQVKPLTHLSATMGDDQIAMVMTHQLHVSSNFNLGSGEDHHDEEKEVSSTPPLTGVPLHQARLAIDIGDIALMLKEDGVNLGGILGIDALGRCAMVRMSFAEHDAASRITLFDQVTFPPTMAMLAAAVFILLLHTHAFAFTVSSFPSTHRRRWRNFQKATVRDAVDEDPLLLQDLRAMTTRQLKEELSLLMISTADVFEKEQLVQRLYHSKKSSSSSSSSVTATTSSSSTSSDEQPVVAVPLFLTTSDGLRLATVNGGEFSIAPNEQQFATIKIEVCPSSGKNFFLTLLLDTACSGVVLRPSAARDLPSLSNPVTMTGAGGVASSTGLTQINSFRLGGATFGPLPAAVQNIDVLPSDLDGIIGLSFLNQFACVEMDFRQGRLCLYKKNRQPQVPSDLQVVADADMVLMGSMGIYAVGVRLGGRGPLKLLVDTGAASTLLNWKGMAALSLAKDSPQVKSLPPSASAMGSDNVAMKLTHRIGVSSSFNLVSRSGTTPYNGVPLDKARLSIDVGDIEVLNLLKNEEIGGILGIDALTRCAMARMNFGGRAPRLTLFNQA